MATVLTGLEVLEGIGAAIKNANITGVSSIVKDRKQLKSDVCTVVLRYIQVGKEDMLSFTKLSKRPYMVEIRVHPLVTQPDTESFLTVIAEKIMESIELITVSDEYVRGKVTDYTIIDGVLVMIAKYSFIVRQENIIPEEKMNVVTITINL